MNKNLFILVFLILTSLFYILNINLVYSLKSDVTNGWILTNHVKNSDKPYTDTGCWILTQLLLLNQQQ